MTSLREALMDAPLMPLEAVPAQTTRSSYWRVDPTAVKSGGIMPTVLRRTDGQALLYPGVVNIMHGKSEAGKSWLSLLACMQEMAAGNNVLVLDYEDVPVSAFHRLRVLGCDAGVVAAHFTYIRPEDRMGKQERDDLHDQLELLRPTLVVIDGVTEALDLEGLDANQSTDIARFRKRLSRPCAALGAVVLEIDHPIKGGKKTDRAPAGSAHKLQGVEGAVYSVLGGREFAEGCSGTSDLIVTKDRPGRVRSKSAGRKRTADIHFDASDDGGLSVELTAKPMAATGAPVYSDAFRDTLLRAVAAHPNINTTALCESVEGRRTTTVEALDLLVRKGLLSCEQRGLERRHHLTAAGQDHLNQETKA